MKRILLKGLLVLMLVTAGMSVSDVAHSASSYSKTVRLIAGKASTVGLHGNVADILVADPGIADVGTLRANRIYIVGKKVGDTNVLIYDSVGNQLANITVHVRMDDKSLQDVLRKFFPQEKISAQTVRSNIILSGIVSSPDVANRVRDLASRFLTSKSETLVDLMKVGGEEQVMLKVKVLEVDRTALKDIGMSTAFSGGDLSATRGAGPWVRPVPLGGLLSGEVPFGMGALATVGSKFARFQTAIQALEKKGLINTLAEPNLTAISGETAGFLAGGSFPVPTSKDSQGNVVLSFKQFGVSLNFTPTVLSQDRIALELSTEVSDIDKTNAVTLQGVTIPGLSVRRAETTVELGSGSSLMIAGLLKSSTLHQLDGMPGIQDLPIIGQLFKSKSFQRDESELVIIVTPYLVKPYAQPDAVAMASPPPPRLPGSSEPAPYGVPLTVAAAKAAKDLHVAAEPVAAVQAASVSANTVTPLTQSFVNNMRKIYGSHAMQKVGTGTGFGYIVE